MYGIEWSSVSRLRRRVVLLRVVRARADHVVRVVAGVQHDPLDVGRVAQLGSLVAAACGPGRSAPAPGTRRSAPWCSVSRIARSASPGSGSGTSYGGVRAVEQPGDHAVLALVDRGRAGLAAHRAVHRLDRHLAGEGRGVRLPGGDLALAGLAGGGGGVQRLPDRLEDRLGRRPEQRADAGRGDGPRWATWSILCLCRQIAFDQVDLDLVAGGDAAQQVGAGQSATRARCWATARIGGMLSPGCEYSAARNVSW